MVAKSLTAESTNEQSKAGLTQCTPEEFERIQQLNAAYNERFGFPFILAVRGRAAGLPKQEIIDTLPGGWTTTPSSSWLRRCATSTALPRFAWATSLTTFQSLATSRGMPMRNWPGYSDPGFAEKVSSPSPTTEAHRECAERSHGWKHRAALTRSNIDAVGNVVAATAKNPPPNTLRPDRTTTPCATAAKYDGRLGIFGAHGLRVRAAPRWQAPAVRHRSGGFAEEEGQRYKATFLARARSSATSNPRLAGAKDADGVTMREAMQHAGLCIDDIAKLQRDPAQYLGLHRSAH